MPIASKPDPDLNRQIVRYTISGALLVLFYSAIYWTAAVPLGIRPLVANTLAFAATLAAGWLIHSRWSFHGHGPRRRPGAAVARFLLVNLAGYALNSFWVWLIVERLGQSVGLSILPIATVTPAASFWLNRRWTFR